MAGEAAGLGARPRRALSDGVPFRDPTGRDAGESIGAAIAPPLDNGLVIDVGPEGRTER